MKHTFWSYVLERRMVLGFCIVCLLMTGGVFALYELPREAVLYVAVLCTLAGAFFGLYDYFKRKARLDNLDFIKDNLPAGIEQLLPARSAEAALYREILTELNALRRSAEQDRKRSFDELTDYYTMWVHQIKTPISALGLLLAEDGRPDAALGARTLRQDALSELFKIEQYTEMVLGYLRTEDISSDMRFAAYDLDKIIRSQIHKYARIFVAKRLSLEYEGVTEQVLTDEKWLGFVIGQILSNALKYTRKGGICIRMSEDSPQTLVIGDTGIGIREEDIPRIFEKGYTGANGREETRSTGIGLYLSAKIMKKLNHDITIRSAPGKGTQVYLFLGRAEAELF